MISKYLEKETVDVTNNTTVFLVAFTFSSAGVSLSQYILPGNRKLHSWV